MAKTWWTVDDIAEHIGVTVPTVRSYVSRGQLPPPDERFGATNVWKPATIKAWHQSRRYASKTTETE